MYLNPFRSFVRQICRSVRTADIPLGSSELWFLNSTPLAKFLRTRIKEPTHSEKRAKRADPNKKTRESFGVVEVDDDDTMTIERKLFSMFIKSIQSSLFLLFTIYTELKNFMTSPLTSFSIC